MLSSKYSGNQAMALIALSRLRPLPQEAKKTLLSRTAGYSPLQKMEALVFALDDPDVRKIFLNYLESKNVQEQRDVTRTLSLAGVSNPQVTNVLRRLQQRSDLDEEVAASVKLVIDRVERKVPEQNR